MGYLTTKLQEGISKVSKKHNKRLPTSHSLGHGEVQIYDANDLDYEIEIDFVDSKNYKVDKKTGKALIGSKYLRSKHSKDHIEGVLQDLGLIGTTKNKSVKHSNKNKEKEGKTMGFLKMTKSEKQAHAFNKYGQEGYVDYTTGLKVGRAIKSEHKANSPYMKGLRRALKPKTKKQRIAYWNMVEKNAKSDKQRNLAKSRLKKLAA